MGISEFISKYLPLESIDINQLLVNSLLTILIIGAGVFLGKIITLGLKKLTQKLEISKYIRGSFADLFIVVIKWSVYVLFISLGLNMLGIPKLTLFFTNILIVIPAFTGALILLSIGFAIAYYLKRVIKNSEVKGWEVISQLVFYFVMLVFGIYAIKTSLISIDKTTANYIIIVLTAVTSAAIAYSIIKKKQN